MTAPQPAAGWHNPSARPSTGPAAPLTHEQLARRLQEIEALCADVYVAAVEVGLPRAPLNRLWVVAGRGAPPQAFAMDEQAALTQATARTPRPSEPAPSALPTLARRRTVLITDDDPLMIEVLTRILERDNYEILVAESGPEALAALADRQALDLLVTDVVMPDMNGPELAARVRQRFPALPVLFQTGFSDILFDDSPDLGDRSAFLEKLFTARGLLEATRMVMFGSLTEPRD